MQEHNHTPKDNTNENEFTTNFEFEQFGIGFDEIQAEAENLAATEQPTPHKKLLKELLEQFNLLDFEKLANPDNAENFNLNLKHYLVLSIENTLTIAEHNSWGLCKNNDFIYLYNGTFWAEIEKETFQKFLGEAAEKMGVAKFSARFYIFREQLFKQFLATAYLPTPEVDENRVLINLKNGTFEVTHNGTKNRTFDRADFLTYQLPFEYNPQAKAPLFESYLNKVLPDITRQTVLAEYLGYVFIKNGSNGIKLEKALVLYGTGANGKSVFFEIVNALLGIENVSSYSMQSLTDSKGYQRAKLANKLVNYASEINGKLETDIFKQMVSGEKVEARLPYGQPFELTNYAKLIFNCNELPKDVEHTNAYFRRFLIVPFDVTIPEYEQDKTLHSKIIENELSGIFNWVLAGLKRVLSQKGFSECNAAKKAIEKYRLESDSVLLFLDEYNYKHSIENVTLLKELFSEYKSYCIESGFKPCSIKSLAERLRNAGYSEPEKRNSKGTVFYMDK